MTKSKTIKIDEFGQKTQFSRQLKEIRRRVYAPTRARVFDHNFIHGRIVLDVFSTKRVYGFGSF